MWLMSLFTRSSPSSIPDEWKSCISENVTVPEEDTTSRDYKYFASKSPLSLDIDSSTRRSIIRRAVERSSPSWDNTLIEVVKNRFLRQAIEVSSSYPIAERSNLVKDSKLDLELMNLLEIRDKTVECLPSTVEDAVGMGFFASNGTLTINVLEDIMKSWRYLLKTILVNIFQSVLLQSELDLIHANLVDTAGLLYSEVMEIDRIYTPLVDKVNKVEVRQSMQVYEEDVGKDISEVKSIIEAFLKKQEH